ncbi:MAG: hypothetical protein IKB01_03295 [Lachnospiraceae bacterium]|nr:hypothetical protein [Lachnospiraceae bacterium]
MNLGTFSGYMPDENSEVRPRFTVQPDEEIRYCSFDNLIEHGFNLCTQFPENLRQNPDCQYLSPTLPLQFAEQIRSAFPFKESGAFCFEDSVGNAYGKMVEYVGRQKIKENTVTTNQMTGLGFLRSTKFADGIWNYQPLTDSCIVGAKKWVANKQVYFNLCVYSRSKNNYSWSKVYKLFDLDEDGVIRQILSRYLHPIDTRAYTKAALQDLRGSVYGIVDAVEAEEIDGQAGWKRGERLFFQDGKNYPIYDSPLALLQKPHCEDNIDVNAVLKRLCADLQEIDFDNRIRFLLGYGLISWLASVCGISWSNRPRLLITGARSTSRQYADCCLKIYRRESGADILNLSECSADDLAQYLATVADDVFVLDAYENSRKKALLRSLISGGSVKQQMINVPLAVLQGFPDEDIEYAGYLLLDMAGYDSSEELCTSIWNLKGILLRTLENRQDRCSMESKIGFCNYEKALENVMRLVRQLLEEAGATMECINCLEEKIKLGNSVTSEQKGNGRGLLLQLFRQRLRKLIANKEVRLNCNEQTFEENCLLIKGNSVYFPMSYLKQCVFTLLDLKPAELNKIKKELISNEILRCYESGDGYTKKITLAKGHRINALEIQKDFVLGEEENICC